MASTLVLEAMAQTGGMLCAATSRWREKMVLAKVESASFDGAARAGDRLDLAADLLEARAGTYRLRTSASVGGAAIAEATILLRGLGLETAEGRAFDTPAYRTARAENLRALGVTDLVEGPA
jgi:3-hydroxymyristoyl/3-hydroxydecanoyl-(acyl carrier protein) dehydratase